MTTSRNAGLLFIAVGLSALVALASGCGASHWSSKEGGDVGCSMGFLDEGGDKGG